MRRLGLVLLVATALVATSLLAVGGTLTGPPHWTPDGLFYQARSLELRGIDRDVALQRTFHGAPGAQLRRIDPQRSGDPEWVRYNTQFYERRVTVPLVAAALEPVAGDRAILDLSLAGYVAAILAIFGLLLLRFRLPIAAAITLATVFLPALTQHSSYPLTDSWGLALETAAFAFGILAIERRPRWVIAWAVAILALSFTRDSTWIPITAAAWLTFRQRSRVSLWLLGTGLAAAVPVVLLFPLPTRELFAQMLNGAQPDPGASWGSIVERYPGAIIDLLHADGGYVRDGAWYSAAYLAGGLLLMFLLTRRSPRGGAVTLLKAGALASVAYVLAVPTFSALRLDLVCVPMAAWGFALAVEWLAAHATVPTWVRAPAVLSGRSGT
jgi:hypothetical protein